MYFSTTFTASALLGLSAATYGGSAESMAAPYAPSMASPMAAAAYSKAPMMESAMASPMAAETPMAAAAYSKAPMEYSKAPMASPMAAAAYSVPPPPPPPMASMAAPMASSAAPYMASAAMAPPMASPMASAMASTAGTVATHVIQVGGKNGTTIYSPNSITAAAGDLVQFQFNVKNHTVTQSTFAQPCVPIQNVMSNKTNAFFSGFMPTTAQDIAAGKQLTFTIRVPDTKPIWFYCSQAKHCQAGMVGAINAPTTGNTIEAFAALAAKAPQNLAPSIQAGSGSSSSNPGAAAPPAAASSVSGAPAAGATAGSNGTSVGTGSPPPAQQTASTASGRISQSLFALGLCGAAAFLLL